MRTLQEDFEAELNRLLASGLTQEEEAIARRYYSQKERDSMDESDFCGPHQTFPIKTQADVDNAAHLIGKAENPDSVKKCIIGKAHAHGWSLPDAWQEDSKERSMGAEVAQDALNRAISPDHEHSHQDDNDHKHPEQHDSDAAERTAGGTIDAVAGALSLSFPIVRSDPTTWAVGGTCTAERPDRHGTIFSYEGAKRAMERWPGNVREQHDGKRAVAKRLSYAFDDEHKEVYLEAYISRTRPDTWQRVDEGILNDFSVSVIPAVQYGTDTRRWPKKEYNGKLYPYLPEYDYAEISLVDAGSLPGAHFVPLTRADGTYTEEVADLEDETPVVQRPLERVSKTISAATKSKLHKSIGDTLMAAKSQMQTCAADGCQDCAAALKTLDPDDDDDIDAFGGAFGDTDGDAADLAAQTSSDDMDRAVLAALERVLPAALERSLSPVYTRLQGIAGRLARSHAEPSEAVLTGVIERAIQAVTAANDTSLAEVRSAQVEVKGQVDEIAKQVKAIADTPVPGAPVQNTSAAPRPVDKRLPTDPDPYRQPRRSGSAVADAIAQLSANGMLDTFDKQVDALAVGLMAQRQGR